MDKQEHLISILRQQRDEANNRLAEIVADANVKLEELAKQVENLKKAQQGDEDKS